MLFCNTICSILWRINPNVDIRILVDAQLVIMGDELRFRLVINTHVHACVHVDTCVCVCVLVYGGKGGGGGSD